MYGKSVNFKIGTAGVESFVLNIAFLAAVYRVGKISAKFRNVKMVGACSDFLIRSKCDANLTMRDILIDQSFCHGHNRGNSGLIIYAKDRIPIGSNQRTPF